MLSTKWERQRHLTFIAFFLETVCLGMEYSLTFVTLWLYLDKEMKVEYPKFFYSIISAAYIFSQISCSVIFSRIADKYRNVSTMFIVGNFLIIIGNIIYTIPFSPWFLFFGRLISGGGGGLRPIMTAEITRCYPFEELSAKFSAIGMAFALGFICGPAINFAFIKFNITVFNIHINYANAPGMYLSFIFIMMTFIAFFLVSNLSKEFDLKQAVIDERTSLVTEEKNPYGTKENVLMNPSTEGNILSTADVFLKVITHVDSLLIIIFSFALMFCMVVYELWQSLAVIQFSHWGIFEINTIDFTYGIIAVILMTLLSKFPLSDKVLGYLSWTCAVCVGLISVLLLIIKSAGTIKAIHIISWGLYAVLFAIVVLMEEIFLINSMAKMADAKVQASAESIRLAFSRIGALTALLTAAVLFDSIVYVASVIIGLSILGLMCLFWRRKSLSDPVIIIK